MNGNEQEDAIRFIGDVPVRVTVELGRCKMTIGDVLKLGPSSVVELDKAAGDSLDVRVNGQLIAKGEAVVVNERFGVRLTSIVESKNLMDSVDS
jgi:flagellar motor switch protein FliN